MAFLCMAVKMYGFVALHKGYSIPAYAANDSKCALLNAATPNTLINKRGLEGYGKVEKYCNL